MPDTVVVDGSYYLPAHEPRRRGRIPRRPYSGRGALRHRQVADHSTDCRTCCRAPTNSPTRSARSASAIATRSSSTMVPACFRRRASGGRFACSAPKASSSSMADCRNGRRKAGRSNMAAVNARRADFDAEMNTGDRRLAGGRADGVDRHNPPRWSMRARPTAFAARRRNRGPACAPVICRARSTCPRPP